MWLELLPVLFPRQESMGKFRHLMGTELGVADGARCGMVGVVGIQDGGVEKMDSTC